MTKPMDFSKIKKNFSKSLVNGSFGFHDPKIWISSGNYALNYIVSGSFDKAFPLGKVAIVAGDSGAGKSYIVSGNAIRDAQQKGIFVILIDTENALDETWLNSLGVDTAEESLLKVNIAMIDDVAAFINAIVSDYKSTYDGVPNEDRQKILIVIDSLGMLMTPTDVAHFEKGDLKGDMGRKPRALKALVTNCTNLFGDLDIGLLVTNHTYESQDMFDPTPKITGGAGFVYASSMLILMQKLKLKEDEDGNKVSDVRGIRAKCTCLKSRYNRPFQTTTVNIPYDTGMNPYSGLIELFEHNEILVKDGNKLSYTDLDGNSDKWFRKQLIQDTSILDKIMGEFEKKMLQLGKDSNGRTIKNNDEVLEQEIELDETISEEYDS